MQFVLNINVDNAAFEDDRDGATAAILRSIAKRIEANDFDDGFYRTIYDANGNDIGRAGFKTVAKLG